MQTAGLSDRELVTWFVDVSSEVNSVVSVDGIGVVGVGVVGVDVVVDGVVGFDGVVAVDGVVRVVDGVVCVVRVVDGVVRVVDGVVCVVDGVVAAGGALFPLSHDSISEPRISDQLRFSLAVSIALLAASVAAPRSLPSTNVINSSNCPSVVMRPAIPVIMFDTPVP